MHLGQSHLGDYSQHDLLTLGRVRVLDVLVQPRLEGARRLSSRVLASHVQTSVTASSSSASDGQNQIAIRFNHIDDMIQTLHDSIQVLYDSTLIRLRNFSDFDSKENNFEILQ